MIKYSTLINNIASDLANFSFTSDSGGGTTQFEGVYKFPNWVNLVGYPFVCIIIPDSTGVVDSNKRVKWDHRLEIHICVNWSVVEGQSDDEKRAEATNRLLEAAQAMREYISLDTTLTTWVSEVEGWVNEYQINDANIFDLQLYRKVIILKLNDTTLKL